MTIHTVRAIEGFSFATSMCTLFPTLNKLASARGSCPHGFCIIHFMYVVFESVFRAVVCPVSVFTSIIPGSAFVTRPDDGVVRGACDNSSQGQHEEPKNQAFH